jgi:hypothetical protein
VLLRRFGQSSGARAWDWFGKIKQRRILALAEILRLEKLRQAHDLGAPASSFADPVDRFLQILFRLRPARHLHQADAKTF